MDQFAGIDRSADLAIVGMSGRFPQAADVEEFWSNLCAGKQGITQFTDEELLAAGVDEALLHNPNYVKAAPVLPDAEGFDAAFFGYSPREAELLDPQQRLFLEVAWEALERSGWDAERYDGRISLYAGAGMNRYLLRNVLPNRALVESAGEVPIMVAGDKDYLATRAAYKLNLKGAAVSVQTACSTSLVAVHLACQSLLSMECDMALAGGVTVAVPQTSGYLHSEGGMVSRDGRVKPFDAAADGTVFGSGAGVVVLKRYEDAEADGDTIYAVIKGSAVNNDGARKVGFTAPSADAQAAVIEEALSVAGVEPESIGLLETHGTGTALGDPIEIAALTDVFTERPDGSPLVLGAVKSSIGHLDAASGVTGLIKAVLALYTKTLPGTLNFQTPSPKLNWPSWFCMDTVTRPWPESSMPRRAGVSSFGFGGTNAHVVLEEAPPAAEGTPGRPYQLLVLSAKTASALQHSADRLVEYLERQPQIPFADAAYTLQVGRKAFAHRLAVVCRSAEDAARTLKARDPKRVFSYHQDAPRSKTAFLFPGTGSQYPQMARELYESEGVFRAAVDRCAELLMPLTGYDLRDIVFAETGRSLYETEVAQVALFVIEYALGELLLSFGVRPDAMIGHSVGEYTAACLAGVFTLEEALRLVALRGQLFHKMVPGKMLAVALPEAEAGRYESGSVSLAAVNAPAQCVLSGEPGEIDRIAAELEQQGVKASPVHLDRAGHSPLIDSILTDFLQLVGSFALQAPQIPFISNVTGTWITAEQAVDPDYWARHLRETVRFAEGMQTLLAADNPVLLEVGPGKTLSGYAVQNSPGATAIPLLRHVKEAESDVAFLLGALGKYWLYGGTVDWVAYAACEARRRVPLPTYPFERVRYWVEPLKGVQAFAASTVAPARLPYEWFYTPVWKQVQPAVQRAAAPERVLVIAEAGPESAALIRALQERGSDVTALQPGVELEETAEGYAALIRGLKQDGRIPNAIFHLGGWRKEAAERFADAAGRGLFPLLYLAQALGRAAVTAELDLWAVGSGLVQVDSRDVLVPERAAVLGACKVIPQEYRNITCRAVDMPLSEKSAALLANEAAAGSPARLIAYRGGKRLVQEHETLAPSHLLPAPRLRDNGTYLITGGFGFLGAKIGLWLAERLPVNLALLSRSAADGAHVAALERLGANVQVIAADVTDEAALQAAYAAACARFGAVHGIFHAAGVSGERALDLIPELTAADGDKHFGPKVRALYALERLVQQHPVDFCLLASSLVTVLGGLGTALYTAAHQFLDAFALQQNERGSVPWITVNWDAKTLEQIGESLERALSLDPVVPLAASYDDLAQALKTWTTFETEATGQAAPEVAELTRHARPQLLTAYVAPRDETEQRIAEQWQELLGIGQVGVYDNFFDLGGNSLLATKFVTWLRDVFEIDLSLRLLFEANTVADVAEKVEELLIEQILQQTEGR
ncbi:acyl transferase domain-containing protein [Tumebacillus sp. BK434]|uniref:type I polyketide synthase n=1 Tax=Tumebacillus sp. BK434 TaxID=2512169 RepID=UPI001049DD33|nr:type I polyketide synthase [Tumebacillus sp. BK434]TCP59317.1 acyl transferase domain-containing protein [Tumebacillus sp. BK434]